MGMHLLQKMGWRPGEGLGKEKNGSLQPLLLEVKLDKKGLVATEEVHLNHTQSMHNTSYSCCQFLFLVSQTPQARQLAAKNKKINLNAVKQNMDSKHPVSLLGEICAKRKYGAPTYEIISETGPFHSRQFMFKVLAN